MSKYVEVSALEKAIIENAQDLRTLSTKTVGQAISSLPTIDIVRCKDCRYWKQVGNVTGNCRKHFFYTFPSKFNDFCSHGERNDNE